MLVTVLQHALVLKHVMQMPVLKERIQGMRRKKDSSRFSDFSANAKQIKPHLNNLRRLRLVSQICP